MKFQAAPQGTADYAHLFQRGRVIEAVPRAGGEYRRLTAAMIYGNLSNGKLTLEKLTTM